MTSFVICEGGHYCPQGSTKPIPCSVGTYNPKNGSTKANECVACPPTKYCETQGLTEPTGDCEDGFICVTRSTTPTPFNQTYSFGQSKNGKCPKGYYCLKGDLVPRPCSSGTYNPHEG